jgi:hypothetical protein
MMRIPMSDAAAGLLRGLLARAQIDRNRILLRALRSVDWQSLTFVGERHEISLRVPGPDAACIVRRLTDGLQDAEFSLTGHIVADVALAAAPRREDDGSIIVELEALTIAE